MAAVTLHWQKCIKHSLWCQLDTRLLSEARLGDRNVGMRGVYIIWTGIKGITVLKVGSGTIKEQLAADLRDPEIYAYRPTRLYATWASTSTVHRPEETQETIEQGIVKFLNVVFKPKLREQLPDVAPIIVNLPQWKKPVPPL